MAKGRIGVVGGSGYLGGEAIRLLSSHPSLELTQVVSQSHAGQTLGSVFPWIADGRSLVLDATASALDVDIALLALPAGEALRVVPGLLERGIRVVDLGPDYRLKSADLYEATYGRPHTDPDGLARAVYGLTEHHREAIASATLVANPGCYPTATLLALLPLLRRGALPAHVVVDAKSGTSGAGGSPTEATHHAQAGASVTPYGGGHHRHAPEIRQVLAKLAPGSADGGPAVTFVPHLVPVVRGLLCSIYAPGMAREATEEWPSLLRDAYAASAFVRLGPVPRLPWVVGSNQCLLATEASAPSGVVYSALDNMVKGGAGQAIQNANLMMGLPETAGLTAGGLGP